MLAGKEHGAIGCLIAAGSDCDAVQRCLGFSPPDSCSEPHCEGDKIVGCRQPTPVPSVDCGVRGLTCVPVVCEQSPGVVIDCAPLACGLGSCENGSPHTCSGGRVLSCSDGVLQDFDCESNGAACINGACFGSGSECADGASRCEGDVLVQCFGGREAEVDCAAHGLRCSSRERTAKCAFGTECSDYEPATCDGTKLRYCQVGEWVVTDCTGVGFSGCSDGADDLVGPRCVP